MHQAVINTCTSLESLSTQLLSASKEDRTFLEVYGWNCAAVTRHDLAAIPIALSEKLKRATLTEIDEDTEELLDEIPRKISLLISQTIPHLYNGNCTQALSTYINTLLLIEHTLTPLISWQENNDNKLLPPSLARSLRSIRTQLDQLTPDKDDLIQRISIIREATEAAESLPTDLQMLIEARNKVKSLAEDAIKIHASIEEHKKEIKFYEDEAKQKRDEAIGLVQQCEEAYRITTTKGLAASFDQRASQLSNTMWVWVAGLIAALITGAVLGSFRIKALSEVLNTPDQNAASILVHLFLSALSIGAPLWFAWLSTKQIGQRFKLAEDYAFKASVAKAYEGYRKEAARIDDEFEARLFSSALTRLEEAPLRLIENENHTSPWQELISSDQFRNAINAMPELKDEFLKILKRGASHMTRDRRAPHVDAPE